MEQWLNGFGRSQLNGLFYLCSVVLVVGLGGLAGFLTSALLGALSGWMLWLVLGGIWLGWLVVSVGGVLYLSLRLQGK